jgi:hypothetical protein
MFLVLSGCAAQPSLEDLEDEALLSGDWSKVVSHEQKLQRNHGSNRLECPRYYVAVCRESGLSSKCNCVPSKGGRTPARQ